MTEAQLVRCLERAAAHQYRALTYLRDTRNPQAALALPTARARLIWALEHVMHARSLLRQARDGAPRPDLADQLERQLTRLDGVETAVTRRLQELGAELDESIAD
ncbi:MAG TPA: hypothetical protein VII06_06415 [Chloroflexota bacterium]|jgi:hypothetical protein